MNCWAYRAAAVFFWFWTSSCAWAGNIGFSISFTGDEVALTHVGNESAYQLSAYTLDAQNQWRKLSVLSGDAAYLTPGARMMGRRVAAPPPNALGRADPLLLLFRDQTGSDFSQLAWRQAMPAVNNALPTGRQGAQLQVWLPPDSHDRPLFTYAIMVPYQGVGALGRGYLDQAAPPHPVIHDWAQAERLTLDSGTGQAGAWLLHEYPAGQLRVQIVPEARARGQEQQVAWLLWERVHGMSLAFSVGAIGALMLALGLFWQRRTASAAPIR